MANLKDKWQIKGISGKVHNQIEVKTLSYRKTRYRYIQSALFAHLKDLAL